MNRLRKSSYFKVISLVLIGLFLFQGNALLAQERGENLDSQWKSAKTEYSAGNIEKTLKRLARLAAACENKGIQGEEIIRIYGLALLLQGICHEYLGESKKAKKFYKNSREFLSYEDFKLPGLALSHLKLYNKNLTKMSKKTGNVIPKEGQAGKKKKFPWLLVAGGAALVIVLYFVLKKKPQYTLTASVGEGVTGSPVTGTSTHKKGKVVNYNYTLKSGYTALVVKLDGQEVSANGTIKMDKDHILTASASKTYTLSVTKGEGVDGIPDSGTFSHQEGENVTYNYRLKDGYTDLSVTLDEQPVPASGSILMNRDHTLTAAALKKYTLTVTKGVGVIGIPDSGTFSYKPGDIVFYNYSLDRGYRNLIVRIDGTQAVASDTITMNKDRTLSASADAKSAASAAGTIDGSQQ